MGRPFGIASAHRVPLPEDEPGALLYRISIVCPPPDGLHFTGITVVFGVGNTEPTMDLVSKCSATLESLTIRCFVMSGAFSSVTMTDKYLTAA